jgi:N,N'-diacetyllegionaminate synthase
MSKRENLHNGAEENMGDTRPKKQVYIIAEIGNTHEGSLGLARCFVEAAAKCGVNAVKFQTHIFDAESLPDAPNPPYFKDETRKQYLERTSFRLDQWKEIKRYAEEEWGVEFVSSCFSLEAVDLLETLGVKTHKIPSGEVTNTPLLIKVAKTGKKVFLSSGMSNYQELDEAVKVIKDHGNHDITLFQCTSQYPCPPEAAGINVIHEMQERYKMPVGFSDHTLGVGIAIAAVAVGASAVEKHFTLSKRMYGPDAKFSLEPDELKAMVDSIRAVEKALAEKVDKNTIASPVSEMKIVFEKSIVAACDIPAGQILEKKHLACKKPGDGIPAKMIWSVLGKRSLQYIPANTKLNWRMIG